MTKLEQNRLALAQEYKRENDLPENEGWVIFWRGKLQGWSREIIAEAKQWRPGCRAVNAAGDWMRSQGGDDLNGATEWAKI